MWKQGQIHDSIRRARVGTGQGLDSFSAEISTAGWMDEQLDGLTEWLKDGPSDDPRNDLMMACWACLGFDLLKK